MKQTTLKSTIINIVDLAKEDKEKFIDKKANEWLNRTKEIVQQESVDTGYLLNSFFTERTENGFLGISSAEHAKYLEYGTEPHFVPFYSKSGKPILADWGKRVLGLTKEEMVKKGGLIVSNKEVAMMRRSLTAL